jgi:hypothetical protein
MFSACITSVTMIVASGASTGALSALVVNGLVRITSPKKFQKLESKEKSRHENEDHRTSKSGIRSGMGGGSQGAAHLGEATDSPAR